MKLHHICQRNVRGQPNLRKDKNQVYQRKEDQRVERANRASHRDRLLLILSEKVGIEMLMKLILPTLVKGPSYIADIRVEVSLCSKGCRKIHKCSFLKKMRHQSNQNHWTKIELWIRMLTKKCEEFQEFLLKSKEDKARYVTRLKICQWTHQTKRKLQD